MLQPAPAPQPAPRLRRIGLAVAAAGGLAVLATGWFISGRTTSDALTPAVQQARQVAFDQAAPLVLPPVAPQERAAALDAMQLPDAQRQDFERQRADLVWLTLWDDVAEDGDVVTVTSDGFSQAIRLTHAPFRLALPRPRSGLVVVTGTFDGGGGITVALAADQVRLAVPVLAVGQRIGIQVR